MENLQNTQAATPESVWAILMENAKQIKELQKTVGGIADNQVKFAEEYFINSFESGKTNFFGEKFDEIAKHLKTR